ncbi:MAG: methyltransferase [Thermodesulfobacteriota bacterium]|nr:methyltransferase [Thermodesulfobacteriota bacterium]
MALEDRLEKITSRTMPLYAMIILLIVFANPTWLSWAIGFIFVLAGEALRIWATGHLRKNNELTTSGPYGHLQSPLYLGSFIITTGLCIMALSPIIWAASTFIFFFSYLPRKQEIEWGRLERMFGDDFLKYKKEVHYFMPRLDPYPEGSKHTWAFDMVVENTEHLTGIVVILLTLFILLRM